MADLTAKIEAGDIIKHIAPIVGGEVPAGRPRTGGQPQRARERAASAIDWIFDDGGDGPFAFRKVCDVLGVDAERLRERLKIQNLKLSHFKYSAKNPRIPSSICPTSWGGFSSNLP